MRTVYDLMLSVARHLTGQEVRVRMTKPDDSDGLCWRDETGRMTIDVSPSLPYKMMAYVFLHEVSHAKLHDFRPLTEAVMRATPAGEEDDGYIQGEVEADRQTLAWLKYGEKYRDRSLDYLEGMLWALLRYEET